MRRPLLGAHRALALATALDRIAIAVFSAAMLLAAAWFFGSAYAQEDESAERGAFIGFVENQISSPNMRIRLGRIDGALSSDVRIASITVADREGIYLTINGARLVWSRLALLRGRLDVDLLEAESIDFTRPPVPAEGIDPAAPAPFAVPELPVSIEIDALRVPVVNLGAAVVGGTAATLAIDGAVSLDGGALDARLAIDRTDGVGGRLALAATYANDTEQLGLDLDFNEPQGGLLSTALNIEGRPAMQFTIKGDGPLNDFAADIMLAADGRRLLGGQTTINAAGEDGLRLRTDLTGTLAPLVPAAYADFVAGESTLAIDATRSGDGTIRLDRANVVSGVVALDIDGALAADGFPTAINIDGRVGSATGAAVNLPGSERSKLDRASFIVAFGSGDTWRAEIDIDGLATEDLDIDSAVIRAGGNARNLADPATRSLDFDLTGRIAGLASDDPGLAQALGAQFDLATRGTWTAGQPVEIALVDFKNPNAAAGFSGTWGDEGIRGDFRLNAADVAAFAGLAGQELAGAVGLTASGQVFPVGGRFALRLDGWTGNLSIGNETVDPLLAGRTTLGGVLSRSEFGLHFTDLTVANEQLRARLEGTFGSENSQLDVDASLTDVGLVTDRASGAVVLDARLTGSNAAPVIAAAISSDELVLNGRPLRNARIGFDGTAGAERVDGRVSMAGDLDGVPLDAAAVIATDDDGTRRISDLVLNAGATRLAGAVAMSPAGLFDGRLTANSPDISVIAPLLLIDAAGAIDADIALANAEGKQGADVTASVRGIRVETISVDEADIDLAAADLFGVPALSGRLGASGIGAGAVRIDRLDLGANRTGDDTDFTLTADLEQGRLAADGRLATADGGYDVTLSALSLTRAPDLAARLSNPVTVAVRGSEVTIPTAELTVGGAGGSGRVRLGGRVGETIALDGVIEALPLALGNAFAPDLRLGGTLSGTLSATGTSADPSARFALQASRVSAAPLSQAGINALDVTLSSTHAGGVTTIDAATDVGGGRVTLAGSIGGGPGGDRLGLDAAVRALPVSLANAFVPDLGAAGTLGGTARIAGTIAAPDVTFDIRGEGLSANVLRDNGVAALGLTANGRFQNDTVTLEAAATGSGGLAIRASGTVPLSGGGLGLDVTGSLPLEAANNVLATRGARLAGTVAVDARVTGSLASPQVNGRATASGASFIDPDTNTRIGDIAIAVAFTGERAVIERFSAVTQGGGTVSVSGSVGFADPTLPADLAIALRNARASDGNIVTAQLTGDLTVTGPLLGRSTVAGRITIDRAEITIPESFPTSAALLDVRHVLPPPNVQRTLERARLTAETRERASAGGISPVLDVRIDAPARIFVRGRGVDAELGGSITLRGVLTNVVPIGSFELIRGRLDIIGQRVTFDSGSVTLAGDLDPYVQLSASTRGNNITVTVTVEGRVSDLSIRLSSTPELPQDEILAQFLFGRSIDDLSPFQIARLAAAVAQLAGGGGGDIIGSIRSATGLDDLDIVTEDDGGVGVQAGRYIADNVYLGVTAGTSGARVSVDLDISNDVKARVEAGGSGEAKAGIYYEREY
ncbi:translocation/assembly module TamB domain-containing protein [Methylobrevis albus]|uniref:Translocation/assembly module TamB domain-containing protein n=1 Tax=Methylobrevis albus TaxID=2793297 RepID=A0A931I141_9HYPH|nr:translocation/assembly module TamB domain-containing protein [Methylobrevis albus]MBH0237837.1 translocation/assembly module TamB domain-containing protein [Methylobrevis albus]